MTSPVKKINNMTRLRLIFILILFLVTFSAASALIEYSAVEAEDDSNDIVNIFIPTMVNFPTATNCRYGVNNRPGLPGNQWMTAIGVGHYINFRADPHGQAVPESIEHIPQIRVQQDRQDGQFLPSYTVVPPLTIEEGGLGFFILANPGGLWIIGNEPDVAHPTQDNMLPDMYAVAYHDIYHYIKAIDPYAHVAFAGLSMMTPGRIQYMDIVWDSYQQKYGTSMPVDVWNMHLYILPEKGFDQNGNPRNSDGKIALGTDPAIAKRESNGPAHVECPKDDVYCRAEHDSMSIFKEQVVAMRTWMKEHGQQNKPLFLSEFSQLYPFVDFDDPVNPTQCYLMDEFGQCFTQERVITFMQNTMDYLETAKNPSLGYPADDNRLVQQFAWYSMWTGPEMSGSSSNLLVDDHHNYSPDAPTALTQVGQTYRDRVFSRNRTINLVAGTAPDVNAKSTLPAGTADVDISVGYFNNGSTFALDPFWVTFYSDAALINIIGQAKVEPGSTGFIHGCSWERITDWTSVTWTDLPVGTHSFWAKIDSQNNIKGETNENDNVVSGKVIVTP
jgi:hypothetical protein